MSTDPQEPSSPATPPSPPAPAVEGSAGNKLKIQVGRPSSQVAPRPTAAPPAPQLHGQKPKRETEKYAGADVDRGEEPPAEVDENKKLDEFNEIHAPRGPRAKIEIPSKRGALSSDLEAELAAAMGELSFEDVLKKDAINRTTTQLENEARYNAPVIRIHHDNVFFSLDGRNEGVASLRNFREPPQVGQVVEVVITSYNSEDGLYELNVPGGAISVSDWSDLTEGAVVDAKITAANTGGLECTVNNLRGFIPASQVSVYRVENLAQLVGEKLRCVVTEANPDRRNLVLSRRAMMEREKEEAKKQTLAELQVGAVREGIVRSIREFGAFVDLGGVDGLIHISQMSWDRIKHPSEVVEEGQKVSVRIEKIDPETGKIGLSLRNENEHPWNNIEEKFPLGSTVKGVVSRIANYGAFVKLAPGIEGLLHISELAHHRVVRVQNHVQEGQEVEVKILEVDREAQRISLSLKANMAAPEPKETEKKPGEEAVEEPQRKPVNAPRRANLRGGTDRPSGGEGIGLKW